MLNKGDNNSITVLFSVCLMIIDLKLLKFSGHTARFKIGVLKVQDFRNFKFSPMGMLIQGYALEKTHCGRYLYGHNRVNCA